MNRNQLAALWGGIALAGLILLFPPHDMMPSPRALTTELAYYEDNSSLSQAAPQMQPTRYAFVYAPPMGSVGIDWPRLLLPLAFVGLTTFGAVASLKGKPVTTLP